MSLRLSRPAFVVFTLLAAFAAPRVAAADLLRSGDTVAVCGDSITEQKLYSVFIEDYLLMCRPSDALRTHQIGWSGEAAPGLLKRLDADVLPFQPTVVTTLYGMNDGGYTSTNPATVAAFRASTEAIIRQLQAGGVRLILIGSPGAVDTEKFKIWRLAKCTPDAYNQTLADLGAGAREATEKTGATFVDVQGPMLAAMAKAKAKYGVDYPFANDGVHPSANGHLVMAYAFLKALGCDGDLGTLTLDAKAGTATGTTGHKVLSASAAKIEIESTRYPFCFVDNPANKESTRAVLDCVPFNEDLNRFRLVVKNLTAPRATVKWGAAEKTFTAAQLAAGINLPAEFLDNPFNESFARVEAAVKAQQAFETPATKTLLHSLPAWQSSLPEEKESLARLQSSVIEKSRRLAADARRALTPVRHTLELIPQP
ncbi:MAG: SGNH/GDSL hydrolase family protein [Verrucomicrobia bacterium]|nr:SGNH/GDSL hydrolase family protein [Verrucomicrobiota bacterium]